MLTPISFLDFDNFEDFKKDFSKSSLYKSIEVSMTTSKSKLQNIQSKEGRNNLIKYRAVVSVSGEKKYGEHGWTRNLNEAISDRDALEKNRPKQIYNNIHTVNVKKVRFGVIANEYLATAIGSPSSLITLKNQVSSAYFKPLWDMEVGDITEDDVSWLWTLITTTRTAQNYYYHLESILGLATSKGFQVNLKLGKNSNITKQMNQLKSVGNMAEKIDKKPWMTTDDIKIWLATSEAIAEEYTSGKYLNDFLVKTDMQLFNLQIAARVGELLAIDKNDIIYVNGRPGKIHIQRQLIERGGVKIIDKNKNIKSRFDLPKYRRKRKVTLNLKAIELVEKYLKINHESHIDLNGDAYNFLFSEANGSPYNYPMFYRYWQKFKKHPLMSKFNDSKIGTHVMRHTKITHEAYLQRNNSYMKSLLIEEVGHKNVATLETYIHVVNEMNPAILEETFSYFKHQYGKVLETEVTNIISDVAQQYDTSLAVELIRFLRGNPKLEPTNSINKLALTNFTEDQLIMTLDAVKQKHG